MTLRANWKKQTQGDQPNEIEFSESCGALIMGRVTVCVRERESERAVGSGRGLSQRIQPGISDTIGQMVQRAADLQQG